MTAVYFVGVLCHLDIVISGDLSKDEDTAAESLPRVVKKSPPW